MVTSFPAMFSAIPLPVFATARGFARRATCISNLKQIALGQRMCTQGSDEGYPNTVAPHLFVGRRFRWPIMLYLAIGQSQQPAGCDCRSEPASILLCPAEDGPDIHLTPNGLDGADLR